MTFAYANIAVVGTGTEMRHWGAIRFALGMMQMAAATVAAVLLLRTGVTTWSLLAAVTASILTTVSVLLFGVPRRHCAARSDSPSRAGR